MNIIEACVEQLEALAHDRETAPLAEALHIQQLAIDVSGIALDSLLRWPQ